MNEFLNINFVYLYKNQNLVFVSIPFLSLSYKICYNLSWNPKLLFNLLNYTIAKAI